MPVFGSFTDYAEAQILNWLFSGIPVSLPPYWYFGYTVSPTGEEGRSVEPGGGGYDRISIPNTTQQFPIVAAGSPKINELEILFDRATASHGIVQEVCIWDSPSGGNVWLTAPLEQPIVVDVNDSFRLETGGLAIVFEPGGLTNYAKLGILNFLFGGIPFNPPSIYHLAWFKSTPDDATPGQEPTTASGYGRIAIARNTNSFPPVQRDQISMQVQVDFAKSLADQGTATHLGLFDAATSGNNFVNFLLTRNNTPNPKMIPADAIFSVLKGDLIVGLN